MLAQNLKILFVVVATLGLYTWVANAIPQVESEVPVEVSFGSDVSEAELVAAGEQLYAGQCTQCHGLGTRAPNLLTDQSGTGTIGQRCAAQVAGQDCKDYLLASMVEPGAYVVEGFDPIMPDQRITLSDNQIWAVIAYLQAQGGTVTVTGADLAADDGEEAGGDGAPAAAAGGPNSTSTDPVQLLQDNTCLSCHLLAGEGVQLGPPFDGVGGRLTADEIRSSILDPGAAASEGYEQFLGVMPAIFGSMFTAEQLEIVVQFLASQR